MDSTGETVIFVEADLSKQGDCRNVVAQTVSGFGRIDILVNCAAPTDVVKSGFDRRLTEQRFEEFEYIMKVGLYGPYWLSQLAIPEMIQAGGGVIINISSLGAARGIRSIPGYSASKAALEALTRSIATDYAGDNIRCVALRLGRVETNDMNRALGKHPTAGPAIRDLAFTRAGVPADVAAVSAFLASDEAAYVSGIVWPFDGGASVKAPIPDLTAAYKEVAAAMASTKT
jgi:NAD(P)-dependent dehydrogenase (short-subunit alcohol dehydrogenase family)